MTLTSPMISYKPVKTPAQSNIAYDSVKFSYQPITGIGLDSLYNRRDNSDIIKVGSRYYVWYTRMNAPVTAGYWGTIWYATSEDEGFTWTERGMALGPGEAGKFDSHAVFTPNILVHGGRYYLYYTGVKPTPGNAENAFENNSTNDVTALGLCVADTPDGPFVRVGEGPILEISRDSSAFDSYRIDDASLLVRDQKIWLYYKGRSIAHGPKGPALTKMGVAFSDTPGGPYRKHGVPLLDKSHEVLIWTMDNGVASLASLDHSLHFAADGIHFSKLKNKLTDIPMAPGLYRPHLEGDHTRNETPGWGIAMQARKNVTYLVRFEMK